MMHTLFKVRLRLGHGSEAMRVQKWLGGFLIAVATASSSCADDGVVAPSTWQGATQHLVAVGVVDGEAIAFELRDTQASDVEKVYCERNYIVPSVSDAATWHDGYLEKIELKWEVEEGGIERAYQIEIAGHDFRHSADGSRLSIVAYDEASMLSYDTVQAAIEWEWEENGMEYELGGESEVGHFTRALVSGTPGADGVVIPSGSGSFGGYLHLTWANGDYLDVSFTVACGDNDMDIP
jgi:hypothetical protein